MEIIQEVLDNVQTTILVCLTKRMEVPEEEVAFHSDVKELSKGNIYLFGHALFDIHEFLGLDIDYQPMSEYELFKTVEDVVVYFYERMIAEASKES